MFLKLQLVWNANENSILYFENSVFAANLASNIMLKKWKQTSHIRCLHFVEFRLAPFWLTLGESCTLLYKAGKHISLASGARSKNPQSLEVVHLICVRVHECICVTCTDIVLCYTASSERQSYRNVYSFQKFLLLCLHWLFIISSFANKYLWK